MRNIFDEVYNKEESKKKSEIFKDSELLNAKLSIIDIIRDYIRKVCDVNVNRICKYVLY